MLTDEWSEQHKGSVAGQPGTAVCPRLCNMMLAFLKPMYPITISSYVSVVLRNWPNQLALFKTTFLNPIMTKYLFHRSVTQPDTVEEFIVKWVFEKLVEQAAKDSCDVVTPFALCLTEQVCVGCI